MGRDDGMNCERVCSRMAASRLVGVCGKTKAWVVGVEACLIFSFEGLAWFN